MAKTTTGGDAAAAKPAEPQETAAHWREPCGATVGEHAGLMIHAGWDVHSRVTEADYRSRLDEFRGMPA